MILDGVAAPQKALGPEIATESQRAVESILARCIEDAECGERFPEIDKTFQRVVRTLTDAPVEIEVPHPNHGRPEALTFGRNEFAGAIRLLAYSPNSIALIPLLVHEAGEQRYAPLAAQYLMTSISLMDSLSLGMHNSVMCSEDVPFYDSATIDYDLLNASYMGPLQIEALQAICSVLAERPDRRRIQDAAGDGASGTAAVGNGRSDHAAGLGHARHGGNGKRDSPDRRAPGARADICRLRT